MRREFEMTPEQHERLLDSCKPVPAIMLHIGPRQSQQSRANDAWERLGKEMGFDYTTVQPVRYKTERFFTAEPLAIEAEK